MSWFPADSVADHYSYQILFLISCLVSSFSQRNRRVHALTKRSFTDPLLSPDCHRRRWVSATKFIITSTAKLRFPLLDQHRLRRLLTSFSPKIPVEKSPLERQVSLHTKANDYKKKSQKRSMVCGSLCLISTVEPAYNRFQGNKDWCQLDKKSIIRGVE